LHQFRHTFACNLARNNVSAIKLQMLLGHSDLKMTQKYLRSLDVEDVREDIVSLDHRAFI
jgi:integrase